MSVSADKFFLWAWCTMGQPFAEDIDPDEDASKLKVDPTIDSLNFDDGQEVKRLIKDPAAHIAALPLRRIPQTNMNKLYEHYMEWCALGAHDVEMCGETTFRKTWKRWHPKHIGMMKLSEHARCSDCARLSEECTTQGQGRTDAGSHASTSGTWRRCTLTGPATAGSNH